ncbi:hypothetical protein [Methylobacterium sp. WSM2598]|uniref:hypothetical protein n=1 Tax=Methylobacterium sp. WSM2598 TaxID=398261 RepID=UPI00036D0870|nr:hypothetical protein [Methylobacterium sp. WSM2598]
MVSIERGAELCPRPAGLQPCRFCGSTAAVVEIYGDRPASVRRLCCGFEGGREWLAAPCANDAVAAEARRHG